jgi:hypothetical protein
MQERTIKLTLEQIEGGADWVKTHKDTPILDTPLWVLISLGVRAITEESEGV